MKATTNAIVVLWLREQLKNENMLPEIRTYLTMLLKNELTDGSLQSLYLIQRPNFLGKEASILACDLMKRGRFSNILDDIPANFFKNRSPLNIVNGNAILKKEILDNGAIGMIPNIDAGGIKLVSYVYKKNTDELAEEIHYFTDKTVWSTNKKRRRLIFVLPMPA